MDPQAELEIARGLRDGQADAWRALYDAYAREVWHTVARQMGPGATDVADVVQETFMAAARSARKYEPRRGSLWMWLCGIARHQVALHYRNRRRHDRWQAEPSPPPALREQAADGLESPVPRPGETLVQTELAALIREVLTELPADYEMLLRARYFDGVSVDDLAATENCSVTAIRSRLARAQRAFRKAYRKRVAL